MELAVVLPALLMFLLIAVDVGRLFFSQIQINNAAREGAAFASRGPTDLNGITAHALLEATSQTQLGENPITVTATCADPVGTTIACSSSSAGVGPGNFITVRVTERFEFFTPFVNAVLGNDLNMSASATSAVLGYAASGGGTPPAPCGQPIARFDATVTTGRTIFADPSASTPNSGVCNISGYTWTWGDGNDDVGSATGDSHTYNQDGTFSITLTVTNQGGSSSASQNVVVPAAVAPPPCTSPIASFSFTKSGKTYSFTDTSTVADPVNCPVANWAWDFGDGVLGNAQNPMHTYQGNNSHTVKLVATNSAGPSGTYSHAQ